MAKSKPGVTSSTASPLLFWSVLVLVAVSVGIIAENVYLGAAFAVLVYFVWTLRRRVKILEGKFDGQQDPNSGKKGSNDTAQESTSA